MDPTIDVLHSALNGLMTRQSVLANNIANGSTPGFQASQVDFETALRQAIGNGTAPPMNAATISPTNAVSNQDGNNENIDADTLSLAQTELSYQAMINAVNGQFSILKTSIEG